MGIDIHTPKNNSEVPPFWPGLEGEITPNQTPETDPQPQRESPSSESLRKIFRNPENLKMEMTSGFHSGPVRRRKGYQLALWSLCASMIDGLLLIAMTCIFLMVFVKILHVPITQSVLHDFAILYFLGSWAYAVTTRFFLGSTIGEAACDMRLGKPQERMSSWYFLKVVFRATLILATGVVLLPAVSLVFGKDFAGTLSGIHLFSLK